MPFTAGFDRAEARDLLYFCAAIEDPLAPLTPNPPPGWTSLFVSPEIGPFQNRWQLWGQGATGPYAVAIRGTIASAGSIFDDLISMMIAAKGTLKVGPLQTDYQFSDDAEAGVHLGFALGALLLLQDPHDGIFATFAKLGIPAGADIYITGHSQGAAIATLMRSYLQYAAGAGAAFSYKTYVFAQPRPGNDHYAEDFERKFSGLAFRVTNTLDWVPQVPFTLQFIPDIDKPNPLSVLASPSLLLTLLGSALDQARTYIEAHARSRLQSSAVAVVRSSAPAAAAPQDLMAKGFEVPTIPSLNFVNAGDDIPLTGVPCAGAQCQDAFFEHHATTYFALL